MEIDLKLCIKLSEQTGLETEIEIYKRRLNLQRRIMEQLRCEMDKRDRILDLVVAGGHVTLVNSQTETTADDNDNDNDNEDRPVSKPGTKTFEMLVREIPFKIETVTLNPIDWDELNESLEKESIENSLFSQDIKPKIKPEPESEAETESIHVNVDQKNFPLPAKRRLSKSDQSDERATTVCEHEPVEKQPRIEKRDCDFLILSELPEYAIGKSFFISQSPKIPTSKFLIRLHDYDVEKICMYEINHNHDSPDSSTSSNSSTCAQKFELSLEQVKVAINVEKVSNPGSKLQIWCDIKNFDIFSQSDSIQSFFQLLGKFISHFTFCSYFSPGKETKKSSSSCGLINSNFLIGFILQNLPNLQFLSINSEMLNNLDDLNLNLNLPPNSKPLKLESLKTLKIEFVQSNSKNNTARISHVFLAKLLKLTPRLESIHGIPLNFIKETAELDKMLIQDPSDRNSAPIPKLTIRSCTVLKDFYSKEFSKYSNDLLNLYNFECGTGSRNGRMLMALEEFKAQRYFIRDPLILENVGALMSRILEMNKSSLETLTLEPVSNSNSNSQTVLKFPRLQNLKTLRFEFDRADFPAFFPYGFQPSHTFPNLEAVTIFFKQKQPLLPNPQHINNPHNNKTTQDLNISPAPDSGFLCRGETFETVQSLALFSFLPPVGSGSECLTKIQSMFPHLTRLQLVNTLHHVTRFLKHVFQHFPHLQQLILEIDTDSHLGNLDPALTGINVGLCKKLEKFVPCPMDDRGKEKLLEIIQTGRSLSDLKELRLLKFVFCPGSAPEFNKIPALTPVSLEYGLGPQQLKNVKVLLDFDKKMSCKGKSDILTSLSPVLPFLTVL